MVLQLTVAFQWINVVDNVYYYLYQYFEKGTIELITKVGNILLFFAYSHEAFPIL